MASQVEIVNRALVKIGEARITSMDDNVHAARTASAIWDTLRDSELRARNWNFAIVRDSLAALVDTPAFGFDYQYQLPSDCLRVVQVGEYFPYVNLGDYRGSSTAMWQIEGGKILTDLGAPLKVRYVSRVETTGEWDPTFVECFACKLAVELAEALTQSNTKRELAWNEYKEALRMANRSDAIENPPEDVQDTPWIIARL
jgi:hypothetical protein